MKPGPSELASSRSGFSLLEVLIALAVLSVGLVATLRAQLAGTRTMQLAWLGSVAELENASLAERIRSCAGSGGCETAEFGDWQRNLQDNFPHIQTDVARNGDDWKSVLSIDRAGKRKPLRVALQFSP